jgi:hypothetical protein
MIVAGGLLLLKPRGEEMENFKAALTFKLSCILANLNKYRRDNPLVVVHQMEEKNGKLWVHFFCGNGSQSLSFPIPYKDGYGNYVVGKRVVRAVGTWMHEGKEYTYWELLSWMLTGRIETAFPNAGKRSQLERLAQSFDSGTAPLTFRSFQDMVNGIVNRLPLVGTPMEAWAMCHRVMILDPTFNALTPQEALEYQQEVNRKYFPWTSIGLSDSGMINNNLLKVDLRRYTPFGLRHHNPMRNLYQALGMKGDEKSLVRSASEAALAEQGVERRGWNWMTCFLDTPLNFEDQLILDNRHLDKFTLENRRFICFGEPKVAVGDELEEGAVLSLEPNGKPLSFWVKADRALVVDVVKDVLPFNGREREVTLIYVETKHAFKEGIKLTNRHGNKGVVSFADCGVMVDERSGEERPIDIVVSAKTIGKRRNYGQVLEALLTLSRGAEGITIKDDVEVTLDSLKSHLSRLGYNPDGTSPVKTRWFTGRAICGWMFWGLIKNPENQLWTKADVTAEDNRGRRRAGTKISHIELKGLMTIFGPQNAIVDEILSYQQGFGDVYELVQVLEILRGKAITKPIIDWSAIKPLAQRGSYFHHKAEVSGTIVDETVLEDGFALRLPRLYHVFVPDDETKHPDYFLHPLEVDPKEKALAGGRNVFLDKVYVPPANLRKCWEHPTGKWGLSDIGGFLNNVVVACYNLKDTVASNDVLLRALNRYFAHVSHRLSTKTGEISTYVLAVRYPHSVKATATLAKEGLPCNWIEIHEDMANNLNVGEGDYVIVERFPCLGFKSLRIQRVRVTNDPQCRFVIRVSGNSLVSQNLDFDGDVLFLMSFHSHQAKQVLAQEFHLPDALRKHYLEEANSCKQPCTASADLNSIGLVSFPELTPEKQVEIVGGLTGIKRGTGTIVALAYNLMRIIEGNVGYEDTEANLAMEVILDKVANSVFGQKHAGRSLEEECKRAICTADLRAMRKMGFPESGSRKLCQIIRREAKSLGVTNLRGHYRSHLKRGHSNVINLIVRKKHRFYFATRADLSPVRFLEHIDSEPTDLTSHLWHRGLKLMEKKHALPMQA